MLFCVVASHHLFVHIVRARQLVIETSISHLNKYLSDLNNQSEFVIVTNVFISTKTCD